MSSRQTKYRNRSFACQQDLCYYCRRPMWLEGPNAFARRYGLTRRQALQRQCTAEHLVARREGGLTTRQNIVAACRFCNIGRHRRKTPCVPSVWRSIQSKRFGTSY